MRTTGKWGLLLLCSVWPLAAGGELVWLPDAEAQAVFASDPRPIKAAIRNTGGEREEKPIYARLYQTSSATMAPVSKAWLWKRLVVLPGQTVLEEIKVAFPSVSVGTPFRLFWLDEAGGTLAFTEILAYPEHLLRPLRGIAGDHPLGVFDPDNRLKPVLRAQEIEFEELTEGGNLETFTGRLVVVAPTREATRLSDRAVQDLSRLARERGLALVWFQSPDKRHSEDPPVAHPVSLGKGWAILSPPSLLTALATSPRSQLNLVWLAGLAVRQPLTDLPGIQTQDTTTP